MSLQFAPTPILAALATAATSVPTEAAHLEVLMLLSFVAMFATLVCYLEMRRSNSYRLAFALGLATVATCGLFQGTLALSLLTFLWAASNVRQWNNEQKLDRLWNKPISDSPISSPASLYGGESRIARLFGSAEIDQKRSNSAS